jgi:hypothetical protein
MLVLLKGEIYELRLSNEVRNHDIRSKFHKDWFRHSKVNRRGDTHTDTHRNRKIIS